MIDGDGLEIPDDITILSDEELANMLTIEEYNKCLNMPLEKADRYKKTIAKRNLLRLKIKNDR